MNFDPYQEWLRIPSAEQPPTYYRLLGVKEFEENTALIHSKTLDRLQKLRVYQAGQHSEHSQRLMNEISQASICLLDPVRKREYDATLRLKSAQNSSKPRPKWSKATRAGLLCGLALTLAAVAAFVLIRDRNSLLETTREWERSEPILAREPPKDIERSRATATTATLPKAPAPTPKIESAKQKVEREVATQIKNLPYSVAKGSYSLLLRLGERELARRNELKRLGDTRPSPTVATAKSKNGSDGYIVVQKLSQKPTRMILQPDLPMPLSFINTPLDEFDPFLDSDGKTLYFCRRDGNREELLFARRDAIDQGFNLVGRMKGLPNSSKMRSPVVVDDGRSILFSSNVTGEFRLYQAERSSALGPATNVRSVAAGAGVVNGEILDPFPVNNGLEMFFTRKDGDVRRMMTLRRDHSKSVFGEPERVPLPSSFHHATLTEDGLTMYLAGNTSKGRWGIFRSRRVSRTSGWSMPIQVPRLAALTGKIGDISPFVSPKGDVLYFASDRDNTEENLDLWVMKMDQTISDPSESQAAAIPDPIDEWLVLGPMAAEPDDIDQKFVRRMAASVRRKPIREGEKFEEYTWRRAGTLGVEKGLYFVALPFESMGNNDVRLEISRSPGGAIFWFNSGQNSREIFASNPDSLWEPIRPKEPIHVSKIKLYRGNYTLFGAICGTNFDVLLNVRLLDAKSLESSKQLNVRFAGK